MDENIGDPENMGLNCVGALTCGNFSVVNSTLLYGMWFVESEWVGTKDTGGGP